MRHHSKHDNSLEKYKFFPYIAWLVVILFTVFVYNIAIQLNEVTDRLGKQTDLLQEQVNQPVGSIEDFTR